MEYGFIDDSANNVKFLEDNYKNLAEAVVKAVAEYKQINYQLPEGIVSNTYVVKAGDSLYSIANKLETTVNELKELNNLTTNLLSIGQVLKIPSKGGETSLYTVKVGDSLYSIARENNTTVDELKKLNNLTTNSLSIGQLLKIPIISVEKEDTYVVQKGDSLYSIAKEYNTSVDNIKSINNLTSNLLSVGQILKIPNTITEVATTYVVKAGDSLYSIAKKLNTTVTRLKELNNLTSNLLNVGQILITE